MSFLNKETWCYFVETVNATTNSMRYCAATGI